ncbi:transposase [Streptomyces sp. NBC_00140]|uniref:transposase n=1 Tax=Streptomyces sp. NBC_00140 TaxID=2975664 RepID=UPI00225A492A|nr:transposase [Streptomyces sp. NBC_00140]MCX5336362.1 transposase [Streptomyces sp. NBC_00140]
MTTRRPCPPAPGPLEEYAARFDDLFFRTDNGIVTVTRVRTDGRVYYPLHTQPYTPAHHFARGRFDPAFRTKPQLAAALAARGKEAGFACRAVEADCAYATSDDWYLALREAGLPYVVALRPNRCTWARADEPRTPIEAAHALAGTDPGHPGDWTPVERPFRGGGSPGRTKTCPPSSRH